jgi:hypothetical protein
MKIKLAEALLRKKELDAEISTLKDILLTFGIDFKNTEHTYLEVTKLIDELNIKVNKFLALDSLIKKANWEFEIEIDQEVYHG